MLKKKSKFKSMLCLLLAVLLITLCCPITASAFEDPFAVSIGSMYVYPISIVEYTEGYYASDYDLEYYRYCPETLMEYNITMTDGSRVSGKGENFRYCGEWYKFDIETNQSYENQWKAGNDYIMTLSFDDFSYDVKVSITKSPIKSLEIKPVSIIENTVGKTVCDYNEKTGEYDLEYYYYEPSKMFDYVVTFNNDNVVSGTGSGFWYEQEWYQFEVLSDQSYEKKWTVGNEYSVTAVLKGYTQEVSVSIVETPVASIEIAPIIIEEYTEGAFVTDLDEVTSVVSPQYYQYNPQHLMRAIITLKDGTVLESYGEDIWYEDTYYYLNTTTDQSYKNQWVAGNRYVMEVSFKGYTGEVPVTIVDSVHGNLMGDVNFDGVVSIIDSTEIQKFLAGLIDFTAEQLHFADINGDGVVSVIDATDIQKSLAGLI